jgi:biopolymer transport protein ExbB
MPVAGCGVMQYDPRAFFWRRELERPMFEIVKAGGIVMVPLILCSIVAVAIALERLWTLRGQRVVPEELTDKVWRWVENCSSIRRWGACSRQGSPTGTEIACS